MEMGIIITNYMNMRKLMFWLLFAAAACACCKQEPEKVRVRFGVSMDMNQTKTIAKMFQELKPDLSDVEFTVGELDGVKVGDEIEITFGNKTVKARVLKVAETVKKDDAADMFELI